MEKLGVEEQLAVAQKELNKRSDEQASLEKKNKQLNEQIKEWEESIAKAKADLEQNGKDQESKKSEIAKQKTVNEEIEKKLKEYEGY
jgi:chromosome segregation ATPase